MTRQDDFEDFADRSFATLCRSGYLICGDWQRAEDAAQETLVRLYQRWNRLRDVPSLEAYARRTLVNLLIDESRRPARRERLEAPPDSPTRPATDRVEDHDQAMRLLAMLTPRQRTCLVLRFYLDHSIRETADLLGCSTGNVSRLTSDALAALDRHAERTPS